MNLCFKKSKSKCLADGNHLFYPISLQDDYWYSLGKLTSNLQSYKLELLVDQIRFKIKYLVKLKTRKRKEISTKFTWKSVFFVLRTFIFPNSTNRVLPLPASFIEKQNKKKIIIRNVNKNVPFNAIYSLSW